MSTIGTSALTLADHAKRTEPDGKVAKIVEMLSQTNEVLQDQLFIEGNLTTGHRSTIRTGLPTVYWRMMNQGVLTSKSTTAQVDEGCGILEAWSEVDIALANLGGNAAAFRLSEASAFIEAMGQEYVSTLFYGSAANPEEFVGLSARYSSTTAANGSNVISGGSVDSDKTSIWLISWGEQKLHGIFPKGSIAGIQHKDHAEQTVDNAGGVTGAKMRVFQDQFIFNGGLNVKDWRYAVRIANIDVSNLTSESSALDLTKAMIKAYHRLPSRDGKVAFYMNRSVMQALDIQQFENVKAGGGLTYKEVDGKAVQSFRGIPVRLCDSLLETESTVS